MAVINHSAKYLSGILIRTLRFLFARISHFSLLLHEHFCFYKTRNTHSSVEITAHTIRVIYDAQIFAFLHAFVVTWNVFSQVYLIQNVGITGNHV